MNKPQISRIAPVRLGRVEKYCITWAYRQKKRNLDTNMWRAHAQATLVLAYARNVLGINVPGKWNKKTLTHYPNPHSKDYVAPYRKRRAEPSVMKGFEKAFRGDINAARKAHDNTYKSINRALLNLNEKGFMRVSQNVGNVRLGGPINKRMGIKFFTFFELTDLGRKKARELIASVPSGEN